jgi:hypothetical protein
MLNHNFLTYSGKIILQVLGEILYFPVWWYSVGLLRFSKALGLFWLGQEESLGLSVWVRNIFVPMYGQRDIASRLISFVMRAVQIIFRGLILAFLLLILLAIWLGWLLLPPFLLLALSFQVIK